MKLKSLISENKNIDSRKAAKIIQQKYPRLWSEVEYQYDGNIDVKLAIIDAIDYAEEVSRDDKKTWDEAKRFMIEVGLLKEVNPKSYLTGKGNIIKYKGKHYDYVTNSDKFFK